MVGDIFKLVLAAVAAGEVAVLQLHCTLQKGEMILFRLSR